MQNYLDLTGKVALATGAYPLGNLRYFGGGLFLTNDRRSFLAIKKWAFAHWVRSTLLLHMTGRRESLLGP
jgi:hypothetical protein